MTVVAITLAVVVAFFGYIDHKENKRKQERLIWALKKCRWVDWFTNPYYNKVS